MPPQEQEDQSTEESILRVAGGDRDPDPDANANADTSVSYEDLAKLRGLGLAPIASRAMGLAPIASRASVGISIDTHASGGTRQGHATLPSTAIASGEDGVVPVSQVD